MQFLQSLPWVDPLSLAAGLAEGGDRYWVFLYSGAKTSYSGRFSFLAYDMEEKITGDDFSALMGRVSGNQSRFENMWLGYLGYGLKNSLEKLAADSPNWLDLPHLCMMKFGTIIEFDHEKHTVTMHSCHSNPRIPQVRKAATIYPIGVKSIVSNMSKDDYLAKVSAITQRIHNGDLYQANLTRKFMGEFMEPPAAFEIFRKLCEASPAPYSAFLRLDDRHILSSSPELFLKIDENGHIRARPIKGTSPRFADPAQDKKSRDSLATSAKDKAENLMIVDLMRNDLSRSCVPGSVATSELFTITSHSNVHHMSSTITGQIKPGSDTLDAIMRCFPPGSMTGAPKIIAMNVCSEMEELERGIYSGAIGWLGGDGAAELSVVIRTLIMEGRRFEFQVGGGIVADSTPEAEFKETIDKSRGILAAIGLLPSDIENLYVMH